MIKTKHKRSKSNGFNAIGKAFENKKIKKNKNRPGSRPGQLEPDLEQKNPGRADLR
jgi:hypothetical protein